MDIKISVLMYGWEFPPHISGGLGIACYGIVKGLVAHHINVALVLPQAMWQGNHSESGNPAILVAGPSKNTNAFSPDELEHLGIQYINAILTPYLTDRTYQDLKKECSGQASAILRGDAALDLMVDYGSDLISEAVRYAIQAGALASKTQHDVIHAHDWLTVLAGIEAKKISGKPLIFHVHSLEHDRSGAHLNSAIFDIEHYGLQEADVIITVSQYTKRMIVEKHGISPEKITVVYNGLLVREKQKENKILPYVSFKEKQKTVLFLGRVTYQKGPFYFLDAAYKILNERTDIQFVIAGDGDLLHDLIEYAAQLRIGRHVHFTGFLGRDWVEEIFQLSDVYVMPSVSEPFGISCLEALSYDVPIIISKQSGASEVLNHALKVDFWDIDEMASKIMALVDYPALGLELLKNSEQDLRPLSWNNSSLDIINVYQKTMRIGS